MLQPGIIVVYSVESFELFFKESTPDTVLCVWRAIWGNHGIEEEKRFENQAGLLELKNEGVSRIEHIAVAKLTEKIDFSPVFLRQIVQQVQDQDPVL